MALQLVGEHGGGIHLALHNAQWGAPGHNDEATDVVLLHLVNEFPIRIAFRGDEAAVISH